MAFFESYPVLTGAVTFVVGLVVALLGNYVTFSSDLSFIKGQLSEVLKVTDGLEEMIGRSARAEAMFEQSSSDLDSMRARINYLETKLLNGGRRYESNS